MIVGLGVFQQNKIRENVMQILILKGFGGQHSPIRLMYFNKAQHYAECSSCRFLLLGGISRWLTEVGVDRLRQSKFLSRVCRDSQQASKRPFPVTAKLLFGLSDFQAPMHDCLCGGCRVFSRLFISQLSPSISWVFGYRDIYIISQGRQPILPSPAHDAELPLQEFPRVREIIAGILIPPFEHAEILRRAKGPHCLLQNKLAPPHLFHDSDLGRRIVSISNCLFAQDDQRHSLPTHPGWIEKQHYSRVRLWKIFI